MRVWWWFLTVCVAGALLAGFAGYRLRADVQPYAPGLDPRMCSLEVDTADELELCLTERGRGVLWFDASPDNPRGGAALVPVQTTT